MSVGAFEPLVHGFSLGRRARMVAGKIKKHVKTKMRWQLVDHTTINRRKYIVGRIGFIFCKGLFVYMV